MDNLIKPASKQKHSTSRISSKTCFNTEAHLVNLIEKEFHLWELPYRTGCLKEFNCSNGIADVVFFELRKGWKENSVIGEIPSRWAFALHKLPYRKYFSTASFAEAAGVTEKRAKVALKEYAELGFCKEKSGGKIWIKTKQPIPTVNKIYAIEAKLRDWKRALNQAYRYLDFANQSWVVLDNSRSKPAIENILQFERLNVGLASIAINGDITVHFKPETHTPKSLQQFWHANSEIASRFMLLNV